MKKKPVKIKRRLRLLSDSISESFGRLLGPDLEVIAKGDGNNNYHCGKCDRLLMENMPSDSLFQNAALLCNTCKTYNDANRYVNYTGTPTMLKDIPENVENEIIFNYSPIQKTPFSEKINDLSNTLYSDWVNEHFEMPGILFQYTSFFGLMGMLSNHSVWITDVAYMNDTSELKYGTEMINRYIDKKMESASDRCKLLLKRAYISETAFDIQSGYLIACFCSNNDLLSQWRAYGGGGSGYNLGFDAQEMTKIEKVQIRKVIYDIDKQESYIKIAIDSVCRLFESSTNNLPLDDLENNEDHILPNFAAMISMHLREYLYTFKHPAFAEEDEWRIIRPYNNTSEDTARLKFRQYNSISIPYMELGTKDIKNGIPFLPIVKVTHGPVLHPQLAKKSLTLIMLQNGYSHAEIAGSQTPLRL